MASKPASKTRRGFLFHCPVLPTQTAFGSGGWPRSLRPARLCHRPPPRMGKGPQLLGPGLVVGVFAFAALRLSIRCHDHVFPPCVELTTLDEDFGVGFQDQQRRDGRQFGARGARNWTRPTRTIIVAGNETEVICDQTYPACIPAPAN